MTFEHYCWCGAWGSRGFGVSLLKGKPGRWYCPDHIPEHGELTINELLADVEGVETQKNSALPGRQGG